MTADAAEIVRLAEKVEQATGPDRELDARIAVLYRMVPLGYEPAARKTSSIYAAMIGRFSHPHDIDGRGWVAPGFTASLDAAMTLVPEEYGFQVDGFGDHWWSSLSEDEGFNAHAPSPALALTAAALRARAQYDQGEG